MRELHAEIERLRAERAQFRSVLVELDTYLDFNTAVEVGTMGITDPSGINAAFEEAARVLAATE